MSSGSSEDESVPHKPSMFAPDTAAFWEAKGILGPPVNNKRTFSIASFASRSSGSSTSTASISSSSSSEPSSDGAPVISVDTGKKVVVPDVLQSKETLMCLGLTDAAAEKVWQRYLEIINRPDTGHRAAFGQYKLIDFAMEPIKISNLEGDDSDEDWHAILKEWGINDKLRAALMDPKHKAVRETATMKYWVLDHLETEYESLENMEEELREQMMSEQRQMSRTRSRAPGYSFSAASSSADATSSSTGDSPATLAGTSSTPASTTASTTGRAEPAVAAATAPPNALPGHIMLWRASKLADCQMGYDVGTGTLTTDPLRSVFPGDFNGGQRVLYLTPQKKVAEQYANWKVDHFEYTNIGIIQIAVPLSLLEGPFKPYELSYSDAEPCLWKRVIWHCRRGDNLRDLPEPRSEHCALRHVNDQCLLVGPIATGIDRKFTRMASYTKIQKRHIMQVPGPHGTKVDSIQWVFQTQAIIRPLERACQGKGWITPWGPTYSS